MVYDWDNKEQICYRMYIEEKKSLEDIMDYMKAQFKFTPRSVEIDTAGDSILSGHSLRCVRRSKRAFQTQFKRWEFPSKQNPAHKNNDLVQRVKELWERNTSQREMLRILNEEDGFDIKERELMRVRAKHRWLLRVPNGMKSRKSVSSEQDVMDQLEQALFDDEQLDNGGQALQIGKALRTMRRADSPELSPEVMVKRQERLAKLQAESAERWATRKRRRRTRGWAGLPADPPGPPRFPSETTIDESKAFLSLDNNLYRDVRGRFQRICEDAGVIKKTIAGPDRWEAVKDRLIQESTHLQSMFWANNENQEAKKLALDVVCTDVTKRMRTLERRMTIAEAKNALGINPEESRQIRNAFYQTLKADHFTSKLEAGDDHWKDLKAQWIEGSDLLKGILAPGEADTKHQDKVKAMEVLCRDVMKRLRDDQTKRDPTRKKRFDGSFDADDTISGETAHDPYHENAQHPQQQHQQQHLDGLVGGNYNPQNEAAFGVQSSLQYIDPPRQSNMGNYQNGPHDSLVQAAAHAQAQAQAHLQAQARAQARSQVHNMPAQTDMQIDPSLLLAANDPSLLSHDHFSEQQYADQQYTAQAAQTAYPSTPSSMAVYFRLHPLSDARIQTSSRLWVSTLTTISVGELRHLAVAKYPNTIPVLIEGIVKQHNGDEMAIQIDQDEELQAYLSAINSVKPVFSVQLVQRWKDESIM